MRLFPDNDVVPPNVWTADSDYVWPGAALPSRTAVVGCHGRPSLRDSHGSLAAIAFPFCQNDGTAPGPLQVTGEAIYNDDINDAPNTLHAALVLSSKPHARIKVDFAPVRAAARGPGVPFVSHLGASWGQVILPKD